MTTANTSLGVVGHESVLQRFRSTLERGRLASTYLLVGPEGVGKRRLALGLAQTLLCTAADPKQLEPCGHCESCRLAVRGAHPDLTLIQKPEGKSGLPLRLFIGEGDQRNRTGLCHTIAMKPMLGRRRIALIDDADDFTIESANSLLKTLEEPPPGALIFLIGTSLAKQLPTIRSRAQVVRFSPLTPPQVAQVLESLAPGEGEEAFTPEAATELSRESGGSVSRALALSDTTLCEARSAIRACLTEGALDPLRLASLIEEQTKAAGSEASSRRAWMRDLMGVTTDHFHAELLTNHGEGAIRALNACLDAEEALARNANQATLAQHLATEIWRANARSG